MFDTQIPPEDKQKTAMKVIVTGESEKVVGIHIIGMGADEMMQGFGVAMKVKSSLETRRTLVPFLRLSTSPPPGVFWYHIAVSYIDYALWRTSSFDSMSSVGWMDHALVGFFPSL